MKLRVKRMWCSVLLLYSVVTIWSFRNPLYPFSFEQILDGNYAVFSPNVPLFPGTFLLNIITLLLLILLAYFNVRSYESGKQQHTMMTVYVYGDSQSSQVMQLTVPYTVTGFQLKQQLLSYHSNTNHVLLYNNKRIDKRVSLIRQVPDFASVVLFALGKGGGKTDGDDVYDECISCGEGADVFCSICQSSRCNTCNELWHSHRSRRDHATIVICKPLSSSVDSCADKMMLQENVNNVSSVEQHPFSSQNESFQEATLIATLAERFGLTKFKQFQKEIILSVLEGKDTVVIQPTGSGKSLCFQFPAVYQQKKAIVVSPTISLMQDQVTNLKVKNINAAYLGSAQLDKKVESDAFLPRSEYSVIFVTPEWIAKEENCAKIQQLVQAEKLSLIAIDEAHLFHLWQEFRLSYKKLEKLKAEFPSTPLMILTATASDVVEKSVLQLVRSPVVSKGSINRPNVFLQCEELCNDDDFTIFAKKVSKTIKGECCIIYTDFINNIGPIMSKLQDNGIDSLPYYGEMDAKSRYSNYIKWKNDEVKVIVATAAFGMGINKEDIRHVVRYGVPESLTSWAQELGRAGRDGQSATATIYYSMGNTNHAMAWIRDHLGNADYCKQLLDGFSNSWKYVMADLAGKCRREIFLDAFGEDCLHNDDVQFVACCDVCKTNPQLVSMTEELRILVDAITVVGSKGEVKIVQWIRGSSLQWTSEYDKTTLSYGNFKGRSEIWWRKFIRQCHVIGFIEKELKSIIKKSGHYAIQGILHVLPRAQKELDKANPVVLLNEGSSSATISMPCMVDRDAQETMQQSSACDRKGKGTHGLIIVKRLLADKENWSMPENESDWQFPGASCKGKDQCILYIEDYRKVYSSCPKNLHFLWADIQLSKGKVNNYKTKVTINGKDVSVVYRSAPCNGVKACSENGCPYVAAIREHRPCQKHPSMPLYKTNDLEPCPVQFAYVYPVDSDDHRRWILGFVRQPKGSRGNLHNHNVHASSHLLTKTQEDIQSAAVANVALKPSELFRGKGLGYIPAAVDKASANMDRISTVMSKARSNSALCNAKWDVAFFEKMADDIDEEDLSHGSNYSHSLSNELRKLSRPYLVSAGFENGIQYIFTMNPLMSEILSKAESIEADITYNETKEYPYLFNAAAFNDTTMDWVVVSRVRLTKQDHSAYCLAFSKTFTKCSLDHSSFKPGESLLAVVTDWSDAEVRGLCDAVGEQLGQSLIRGCRVHWNRSWQRIRDRVACSKDKNLEKCIFSKIASQISKLPMGELVCTCFEVLSSQQSAVKLLGTINSLTSDEATFVDKWCNWSKAKNWAEWWLRPKHLQMLHKDFSTMDPSVWSRSPSTTNAVERLNAECKSKLPIILQHALSNVYKLDKSVCAKHLAGLKECSVSYREKTESAKRASAAKRQQQRLVSSIPIDPTATHGPPDRACHFNTVQDQKNDTAGKRTATDSCSDLDVAPSKKQRKSDSKTASSSLYKAPKNSMLGRKVLMKFNVNRKTEWFQGIVNAYDGLTGKYGVYFPCDKQTVYIPEDDKDIRFVDW